MKTPYKISALAVTINKAQNFEPYLERLWFVDEIIIVDAFSSDQTAALASKNEKVTVYQRDFDDVSAQKSFAISKSKNDWVTFFDLDEEVTEAVANEILSVFTNPEAIAYSIKRSHYFMGKRLKYSGFQNDYVIRFFNKNRCQVNADANIQAIDSKDKTSTLTHNLPYFHYKSLDEYTGELHLKSELEANALYEKGKKPNLYDFLFKPNFRFWHKYLFELAVLDGKEGFILAYISAFSEFKKHLNLWLLYRKIE
ncbi:glycosyltransferase family 2 protein [Gelidibacter gilvus]|uniref:Glycosyltransferase family 2 protein n=1 Tax=Gelidibacter gilvus TaxID=59602 RepID=A0A4Q0XJ57_9FLAO|nr:glycosyltransferase family 2 protein [Gelidibacter gilvus]RXJ52152.1 glycosyltransferase family 2 protein [Gelidibacter gilvus]